MTDLDLSQERAYLAGLAALLSDPDFAKAARSDPALRANVRKLRTSLRELAVAYEREAAEGDAGEFLRRVLGPAPEARA